jgi:hypothetical protein
MRLRWKIVNYAEPMPAQFMGKGLVTSDDRFFVGARYVKSSGSHINWGAIDFREGVYADEFARQRDAKAFVENGWKL